MDEQTFWTLIEASRAESTPQASDQAEVLREKLKALPAQEIVGFARQFTTLLHAAYRWDLWGAAYVIEGGCSDDGFEYFRAGLIGLGRDVFTTALRDPSSLVKLPAKGIDFSNEELLYVADEAHEAVTGKPLPELGLEQPDEPAGEPFDEDTVDEKYPALAKKFGGG